MLKERIPRRAIIASVDRVRRGRGDHARPGERGAQSTDRFVGTVAVLLSAVCYAYNIVLMRQQAMVAGPSEVAFFQSVIVGVIFACFAPFFAAVPDARHIPAIVLAAALATVSLLILAWAYARGEANYLAPTEYTGFIWAALWGWVVFHEPVAPYTLAGAAMIIAGCLVASRRRTPANVEAAF